MTPEGVLWPPHAYRHTYTYERTSAHHAHSSTREHSVVACIVNSAVWNLLEPSPWCSSVESCYMPTPDFRDDVKLPPEVDLAQTLHSGVIESPVGHSFTQTCN